MRVYLLTLRNHISYIPPLFFFYKRIVYSETYFLSCIACAPQMIRRWWEIEDIHNNNLQHATWKLNFLLCRSIYTCGFHFYAMEILLKIHSIPFALEYTLCFTLLILKIGSITNYANHRWRLTLIARSRSKLVQAHVTTDSYLLNILAICRDNYWI